MKINSIIRKISIGSDYKNDAMHYAVGQQVYGGHEICNILFDEKENSYSIFIKKKIMTFCRGKSLITTWPYQLSTI